MQLASIVLVIHGLVTVGYGIALLVNPAALAEFMGLMIANSDGRAELVTMYVGMSCTMGLFMLVGAFSKKWRPQAMLFLLLSMSGIMLGRGLSYIFFAAGNYTLNALLYDIFITLLAWIAYAQLHRTGSA